ncbi:MAG TPA: hypothetical protein VFR89_05460, partial [candidate division Zixibacteria bacterium]|nr:hypothetical protein [candidate division Zixibacteria bacterium]
LRTVVDSIILNSVNGAVPYMLTLNASEDTLFAACWGGSTMAVVELSTKIDTYIPVGFQAHAPVIVADSLLYVTCEGNHRDPYKIYVVNIITQTVVDSIDVGRYPNGIAVLRP